jgi:hypothetical protein
VREGGGHTTCRPAGCGPSLPLCRRWLFAYHRPVGQHQNGPFSRISETQNLPGNHRRLVDESCVSEGEIGPVTNLADFLPCFTAPSMGQAWSARVSEGQTGSNRARTGSARVSHGQPGSNRVKQRVMMGCATGGNAIFACLPAPERRRKLRFPGAHPPRRGNGPGSPPVRQSYQPSRSRSAVMCPAWCRLCQA